MKIDLPADNEAMVITDMNALCRNSIELIRYARGLAVQHINIIELMTNYALGRWIVEEQQNGQDRAKYGAHVIDRLSEALTEEFGRGYSKDTLKNVRKFYLTYKDRISEPLFHLFAVEKREPVVLLIKYGQCREVLTFSRKNRKTPFYDLSEVGK
ncbi:MAG: hypothetical protein IKE03_10105 [Blautia sp.]|nr:hypothetical protein [Blautia sp.]